MRLLAYRAGEDSLVNLLVLGGSWLSVAVAVGRSRAGGPPSAKNSAVRSTTAGLRPDAAARAAVIAELL